MSLFGSNSSSAESGIGFDSSDDNIAFLGGTGGGDVTIQSLDDDLLAGFGQLVANDKAESNKLVEYVFHASQGNTQRAMDYVVSEADKNRGFAGYLVGETIKQSDKNREFVGETVGQSLDFAEDTFGEAIDFVADSSGRSFDFAEDSRREAVTAAAESRDAALDFGELALGQSYDFADASLGFVSDNASFLVDRAVNFGFDATKFAQGELDRAEKEAGETRDFSSALVREVTQNLVDSRTSQSDKANQQLIYVIAGVAALAVIAIAWKR